MNARTSLMKILPLVVVSAIAVAASAACGGGKDANNPTTTSASVPPGGFVPGGGTIPPGGGTMPPGGGTTAPATSASNSLPGSLLDPNLLAQITQAGAALMGGGAIPVGDPVDLGIKAAALTAAPGMQAEGPSVKDTLTADGHKSVLLSLQGGKCYTFVAFSPLGQVTNVDLHLLTPPLYNMEAGHDDSTSNIAVIGRGSNPVCPFFPVPVQYKLDVHAKVGQGAIGLQMYSKTK